MKIYIMPHERHEALQAYTDWLSAEQKEQIEEADEDAIIVLHRGINLTVVDIVLES